MTESSPAPVSITTETARYRSSMAGFLKQSLVAMNDLLSKVDFDELFRPIDGGKVDEDPLIVFRRTSHLLIAKARLHVIAALRANQMQNIHSLAVQMRPALECAGQVVSQMTSVLFKPPGAANRIARFLDADYYQTVVRLLRGQVDHDELLKQIGATHPGRNEPLRKVRKFRESEKVRDLEFGDNWYGHLSHSFYHTDVPGLKGIAYCGGVASCNTLYDQYAFACMLDYLAHQMMVMLMYDAMCAAVSPDGTLGKHGRVEKMADLLQRKKTTSEDFRTTLMSMAGQRDQ